VGSRPYPEDDLNALVDMRLKKDIPDPAALVPGLPEALRTFILKACQRKREGWYQSIREALDDLQPLHDQICRAKERGSSERRRITTLCLLYQDEQQLALNQLLEELGNKLSELGVRVKTADFGDNWPPR